jgi:hypothetical protein
MAKKKYTPDPDQKPGGDEASAGRANNEATRPLTSGIKNRGNFVASGTGRGGGEKGMQRGGDKGRTQPGKKKA